MSDPRPLPVDDPGNPSQLTDASATPASVAPPAAIPPFPTSELRKDHLLDKVDDLLSGPRAARIISGVLIVLVAAIVCFTQISDTVERWRSRQHQNSEYSSAMGTHAPSKDNAQGASQAARVTPQEEHLNHHIALGDGRPLTVPAASATSTDTALVVEYFTSDGCIFVHRHHGKVETNDWLQDKTSADQALPANATTANLESGTLLEDALVDDPRLQAAAFPEPHLQRVQGRCFNPHPGPFTWWWGPPQGCWVPMYRQFQDSCTHHQMFNSCGNYWDATIYWDRCMH